VRYGLFEIAVLRFLTSVLLRTFYLYVTVKVIHNSCSEVTGGVDQVLGTEELNTYLSKYWLELDPHLEVLVGRPVLKP
jgi:hypothetical protein